MFESCRDCNSAVPGVVGLAERGVRGGSEGGVPNQQEVPMLAVEMSCKTESVTQGRVEGRQRSGDAVSGKGSSA